MTATRAIELVPFDPERPTEVDELKRQRIVSPLALARTAQRPSLTLLQHAAVRLGLGQGRGLAGPGATRSQGAFSPLSLLALTICRADVHPQNFYWIFPTDRGAYKTPDFEPINHKADEAGPPPPDLAFQPIGHVSVDWEDYDPNETTLCDRVHGVSRSSSRSVLPFFLSRRRELVVLARLHVLTSPALTLARNRSAPSRRSSSSSASKAKVSARASSASLSLSLSLPRAAPRLTPSRRTSPAAS